LLLHAPQAAAGLKPLLLLLLLLLQRCHHPVLRQPQAAAAPAAPASALPLLPLTRAAADQAIAASSDAHGLAPVDVASVLLLLLLAT
jgi:hypothetical protein